MSWTNPKFSFEPFHGPDAERPDSTRRQTRPGASGDPYTWRPDFPRTLVVACSDGRLVPSLDRWLSEEMGLEDYDRVYVPGGPGGIAGGASEYLRAELIQRECAFLVEAHGIRDTILVFHGAAEGGPDEAVCGDYLRKNTHLTPDELNRVQDRDLEEILRAAPPWLMRTRIRAFRAEVDASGNVRFVAMAEVGAARG